MAPPKAGKPQDERFLMQAVKLFLRTPLDPAKLSLKPTRPWQGRPLPRCLGRVLDFEKTEKGAKKGNPKID
jgi:hypothetical protein